MVTIYTVLGDWYDADLYIDHERTYIGSALSLNDAEDIIRDTIDEHQLDLDEFNRIDYSDKTPTNQLLYTYCKDNISVNYYVECVNLG